MERWLEKRSHYVLIDKPSNIKKKPFELLSNGFAYSTHNYSSEGR